MTPEVDERNRRFWNELCGSGLARNLGIRDFNPESLQIFDRAYLDFYPYLRGYLDPDLEHRRTLEIGLGYGTLSQLLIEAGADYHGVDLCPEPVRVVQQRWHWARGSAAESRVLVGSALHLPFADASFDSLYSIGCFHHTGNLQRAVQECRRVLVPGGRAVVMLYHRHSLRQMLGRNTAGHYDRNLAGDAAPHTDFVSRREARELFRDFRQVRVDVRNMDCLGPIPRRYLLGNLDRLVGLDLYIVAHA